MKKVLSIVLSLSMVLGSFGLAFAATPNVASKFSDVNGKNCEEAVKVLSDLSVVTGYDDGTYKPENIVTRAEMAVLVVNALGLQNYVTTASKSSFKDMDGYGWAEGYISYAQSAGIISGYGDGTFKPGKTVSYDEAATMLVAALGYTPASLQGSWPANYVTKAKSLGILDDVKAGPEGANRGDTAVMLYQTIDQKIGFVDKNNVWAETQGKQIAVPGYKDKVNAGDKMIYRLGAAPEDTQIDSVVNGDESSLINLTPYVGMCATKYYKNNQVIAITDIQSSFIKGSFSGKDITAFTGDDDVDYTISLPNTSSNNYNYDSWDQVQYFYNGQPASKSQLTGLGFVYENSAYPTKLNHDGDLDATLAVKDTGKTIKTLYSVSIWDHKDQGSAGRITQADLNSIKDDKTLLGQDFTTLKDGSIDPNSYALEGVKDLKDIAVDNITFVYTKKVANKDKITKVAVSQEVVKGDITKTNISTDTPRYTIDGKSYKTTDKKKFDYGVGDTVKAFLDPDGKIYDMDDVSSTADNYAIVLQKPLQGSGIDIDTYKVKLFTKDGNTTTFEFKDADSWTKSPSFNKIQNGDLVTYDLNSAGKITSLNYKTANDRKTLKGKVNNGVVGGLQLADNAVVFTVDLHSAHNDQDGVRSMDFDTINVKNIDKDENIQKDGSPFMAGYYATGSSGKVKALIIDQSASGSNNSYGFIDSVKVVKNSKGDKVREITAYVDGKTITAQTDGELSKVDGYTDDDSTLFRFDFNGDLIKDVIPQRTFIKYEGGDSDAITKDNVMIANRGDWQQVYDVNNGDLKLAAVGDKDNATYKTVKGAKAYLATFDRDGGFDGYQIGNVGNINTGYVVTMFQTDKNSSTADLVVYVKKSDADYVTKKPVTKDIFSFTTALDNITAITVKGYSSSTPEVATLNGYTSKAAINQKITSGSNDVYAMIDVFDGPANKVYTIKVTPTVPVGKVASITLSASNDTYFSSDVQNNKRGSITIDNLVNSAGQKTISVLGVNPTITATMTASTVSSITPKNDGWTATLDTNLKADLYKADGTTAVDSTTPFNVPADQDANFKVKLSGTGATPIVGEYHVSLKGKVNGASATTISTTVAAVSYSGGAFSDKTFIPLTISKGTLAKGDITDLEVVFEAPTTPNGIFYVTFDPAKSLLTSPNGNQITLTKVSFSGKDGDVLEVAYTWTGNGTGEDLEIVDKDGALTFTDNSLTVKNSTKSGSGIFKVAIPNNGKAGVAIKVQTRS